MTPLNCFDDIYFKREDTSVTGSAKDRAIPRQISSLISQGFVSAVISSTGNAAISAQHYCAQNNISLTIFVSPKTPKEKLSLLTNYRTSQKPISDAIKFSKATNSYLLRQSTDNSALEGYSELGGEILQQLPGITSIFFPIGSGATLVGVTSVFPDNIKVFAIQSAFNCPITKEFSPNFTPELKNITDSLTAKFVPLKHRVHTIIKKSGGSGLVISNQEVMAAQLRLENYGISCSNEGGLAMAGFLKAKESFDIGNKPLIIITGTKR